MGFYSLENRFLTLEYRKRHFPGLYCVKNESLKNFLFFDQNHGLEKCQYLDFLNFLFFSLDRRFFVLEYHERHFPGLYYQKKSWKNGHFLTKPWVYLLWNSLNFFKFLNLNFFIA